MSKKIGDSQRNFFSDVYEVVKLIPKGRVTTYGAIAHFLGAKSGARMVGWALNDCPSDVPAHRVVNSIGLLTGKHHFKPPSKMEKLLRAEGVKVKNDRIEHFNDLFWHPSTHLTL